MKIIGNILWLILGGLVIAAEYPISSLLLMVTIVGIPFGIQTLKLSVLALWPFGSDIQSTSAETNFLFVLMNIIWLLVGGIWIALTHIVFGILCAITIIGIPFAKQHFKLAALALTPFGKEISTI